MRDGSAAFNCVGLLGLVDVALFSVPSLQRCAVKQPREKEKKEKKEKTKDKEKEEAPPPAASEAAASAVDDEDKPSETKRDEPKKKIGNIFALFNQSQIQEFKEVGTCFPRRHSSPFVWLSVSTLTFEPPDLRP